MSTFVVGWVVPWVKLAITSFPDDGQQVLSRVFRPPVPAAAIRWCVSLHDLVEASSAMWPSWCCGVLCLCSVAALRGLDEAVHNTTKDNEVTQTMQVPCFFLSWGHALVKSSEKRTHAHRLVIFHPIDHARTRYLRNNTSIPGT